MARYAEKLHIVPLLAPAASTAGGGVKSYAVRLKNTQWLSFLLGWGDQTTDDAAVTTITVEASTAVGNTTAATDTAILRTAPRGARLYWATQSTNARAAASIGGKSYTVRTSLILFSGILV